MKRAANPETLQEAILFFADYENCHKTVLAMRWPDGIVRCPSCGSDHVTYLGTQKRWKCYGKHPKAQFSLKVGTVFEDSPLPLQKWLPALWLLTNSKNGISSYEVARALGVTQPTAWFMLSRLRLAMQDDDKGGKLSGIVEVDESYIGAKARNMSEAKRRRVLGGDKGGLKGKTAVQGMLERSSDFGPSKVKLHVVKGAQRRHLMPNVVAHVEPLSQVYTDALKSYEQMPSDFFHKMVDHAARYVDGQVHTNGLENFWSLLKRMLNGTYVSVEPFHLFRYLDEQAFRFNNRKMSDAFRFAVALKGILGKRLTYTALTGSELPQTS